MFNDTFDDEYSFNPNEEYDFPELFVQVEQAITTCNDALSYLLKEQRKNVEAGLYAEYAKSLNFSRVIFGHLLELQPMVLALSENRIGEDDGNSFTPMQVEEAVKLAIQECEPFKPNLSAIDGSAAQLVKDSSTKTEDEEKPSVKKENIDEESW